MLDSQIEAVTVFRRGARVTRVATLALGAEVPREVRIGGLPLCLDDGSIRTRVEATADGEAPIAVDARVVLSVADADHDLAPADDEALAAAEDELARLKSVEEQLDLDLKQLEELVIAARPRLEDQPPAPSPTAARAQLLALRAERRASLEEQRATLRGQLRDATRRVAELRDRDARHSTARQAREHELRKCVVVSLFGGSDVAASARLVLDYVVPGACWAPSYSVRLSEDQVDAELELRAHVAQRTGEDWMNARITLSTAAADAWTELPELASRRIGRKQAPPTQRGWRPAPLGADALYADFDRAMRRHRPPPTRPAPPAMAPPPPPAAPSAPAPRGDMGMLAAPVMMQPSPEMSVGGPPGAGGAPPAKAADYQASMSAPQASRPAAQAPMRSKRRTASLARGLREMASSADSFGGLEEELSLLGDVAEPSGPLQFDPRLAYGRLRMPSANQPGRGTLVTIEQRALYLEFLHTETRITEHHVAEALQRANAHAEQIDVGRLPTGHHLAWTGHYDHAYETASRIDVPADGEFHNVPVSQAATGASVLHVVVPRESEDVFRMADIPNAFDTPLMAGPVDVYLGRNFLVTSELDATPAGGQIRVGLGVAQGVKVARNTRFEEESTGLIRGALLLHHRIDVEVANHSGRPIELEVRERVPVVREGEEDIKLEVGPVSPAWTAFDPPPAAAASERLRGGFRWRMTLAEGQSENLEARYSVRIAAKHELVGGNRREG